LKNIQFPVKDLKKKSLINNRERTNSKLKRILASRVYFE
jgi:hypothetical protein